MTETAPSLKEFISQTLTNIAEGVSDANNTIGGKQVYSDATFTISDSTRGEERERIAKKGIEFDIAVAVVSKDVKSGKIGITVPVFGAVGAGQSTDKSDEYTSRIKFNVDVSQSIDFLKEDQS